MNSILRAENVSRSYPAPGKRIPVLTHIDFSMDAGEFTAIMGPSGCGKSSLLYLLGGLDTPTSGSVHFKERDFSQMDDQEKSKIRRRDIGFVFQFYNLVQNLSVAENILLPITMDGKKISDYKNELEEILDIVGMRAHQNYTPRELSGGQQQRTAIARSLIASPSLILADEPTGNLDSISGKTIMELFRTINTEKGISIIQVTHSEEAAAYSSRQVLMKDGRITSS